VCRNFSANCLRPRQPYLYRPDGRIYTKHKFKIWTRNLILVPHSPLRRQGDLHSSRAVSRLVGNCLQVLLPCKRMGRGRRITWYTFTGRVVRQGQGWKWNGGMAGGHDVTTGATDLQHGSILHKYIFNLSISKRLFILNVVLINMGSWPNVSVKWLDL
jgi:hypothetical protein